ncbi:MAG: hypothetical protein O2960_23660 [Verrucomicrobia bacterium]|nr:hypothetical protein [Verrucomicrobiota bacterium]
MRTTRSHRIGRPLKLRGVEKRFLRRKRQLASQIRKDEADTTNERRRRGLKRKEEIKSRFEIAWRERVTPQKRQGRLKRRRIPHEGRRKSEVRMNLAAREAERNAANIKGARSLIKGKGL